MDFYNQDKDEVCNIDKHLKDICSKVFTDL